MITAATLYASAAHAQQCSNPKIYFNPPEFSADGLRKLNEDFPPQGQGGWTDQILSSVFEGFEGLTDGLTQHDRLSREYTFETTIDFVAETGSRLEVYQIFGNLMDTDTNRFVRRQTAYGPDLQSALANLFASFGDLYALIRAYEIAHPAPPRDPRIEVETDPDEILPKDGEDESEITVTVYHCNGRPAYDKVPKHEQRVLFPKSTERGTLKACSTREHVTYCPTDPKGQAKATYRLDYSKGTDPGLDTFEIKTRARGVLWAVPTLRYALADVTIRIKSYAGSFEIARHVHHSMVVQEIDYEITGDVPFTVDLNKDPPQLSGKGWISVSGGGSAMTCKITAQGGANVELSGYLDLREEEPPLIHLWWHESWQSADVYDCPSGSGQVFNWSNYSVGVEGWRRRGGLEFVAEDGHQEQVQFSTMGSSGSSTYTLHLKE